MLNTGDRDQRTARLLERESQREDIERLLLEVGRGHGSALIVEGPAGIGKTALLRLAAEMTAQTDVRTLQAGGGELERNFSFGVVRQLFEPALAGSTVSERDTLLRGVAAHARPVVDRDRDVQADLGPPDTFESSLRGLYWLAANLAEYKPLLVLVDDVHWSDSASLRFLAYLAYRLADLPVGLLLAARTDNGRSEELRQVVLCARAHQLAPLSQAAVAALAADRLQEAVSADFASACAEVTAGNPYLIGELLASLAAEGVKPGAAAAELVRTFAPSTVGRAVLARLAGVSPAAERLARAIAVLGRDAKLRHAAHLAALDEAQAATAVDALVVASVVRAGRPLEFVHPLVRSAVYAELPPAAKGLDHRRAAHLLADEDESPERVATHLLAVEPAADGWVVARLRDAAARALRAGAPDAAARYLARARDEPPSRAERSTVLLELGMAEGSMGAADALTTLRAALESAPDVPAAAAAARALARVLHTRGESLQAAHVLESAINRLGAADAAIRLGLEADLLLMTQSAMSARRHVGARLARARAQATNMTGTAAAVVQAVVAVDLAHTDGTAEAAAAMADMALRGAKFEQPSADVSVAFYLVTVALGLCDRLSAAKAIADACVTEAQQRGSLNDFQKTLCLRSWVLRRQGRLLDAEADARLALDQAPAAGDIVRPWKLANLADALLQRDRLEEAQQLLTDDRLGPYDVDSILYQPFRDVRAQLHLASGRASQALDHLQAESEWEPRWGVRNTSWTQWRSHAATAHLALGNNHEACLLASTDLERARAFGAPRAHGIALRTLGMVSKQAGIDHLRASVKALSLSEDRLEHARALLELGAAQRRAGRPADARDPLRAALDMADRCGALALARRAREELHAAGARPRRARLSGVEALTPQERRIAQLAAEAMTNRRIAESLFVTTRTIEMHLANAYAKLGIATRKELPRLFGNARENQG